MLNHLFSVKALVSKTESMAEGGSKLSVYTDLALFDVAQLDKKAVIIFALKDFEEASGDTPTGQTDPLDEAYAQVAKMMSLLAEAIQERREEMLNPTDPGITEPQADLLGDNA